MSNGMLVNAQARYDIFRLSRENQKLKQITKLYSTKFALIEAKLDKLTKEFME